MSELDRLTLKVTYVRNFIMNKTRNMLNKKKKKKTFCA